MIRIVKTVFLISVTSLFLLVPGCERNPVQEYGDTLVRSKQAAQSAADKAEIESWRKSIELFRSDKGRLPGDADELGVAAGKPFPADRFIYDSQTGDISVRR